MDFRVVKTVNANSVTQLLGIENRGILLPNISLYVNQFITGTQKGTGQQLFQADKATYCWTTSQTEEVRVRGVETL
jgi:hypothetical protein